jgi:ATP-dependent 26S proteasome regulatory subunit
MHRRLQNVYYEVRDPILAWEDIGGLDDVKTTLREMVCLPFTRRDALRAMGVIPPAGVIMWGPLGNGITMLAEACAREAGVTFFYVSGQEMLGKPGDLEEAFSLALREAPCLLYVTDVDWLAPRAGADYRWADGSERGKPPTFADPALTRTFVECLDRVQENPEVALLGSAYRIDVVDQAVVRDKNRFNRKVFVHPPTQADREAMFRLFLSRMPSDPGIDVAGWARRADGFVGWDLENFCKKAALAAVEAGRSAVVDGDLETAFPKMRPWLQGSMAESYREIFKKDCPHHYTF